MLHSVHDRVDLEGAISLGRCAKDCAREKCRKANEGMSLFESEGALFACLQCILDNENEKYRELGAYVADAGGFEAGETGEVRDALEFEDVVRKFVDWELQLGIRFWFYL
jgi:hypothetical protein